MAREKGVGSVPQVAGKARTGPQGIFQGFFGGIGMGQADDHSPGDGPLDEGHGSIHLRREGDQPDSASAGFLKPLHFFPIRPPDKFFRVGPPKSFFGRNVGAFQMDPPAHFPKQGILFDGSGQNLEVGDHPLVGSGGQGGEKASDSGRGQGKGGLMELFGSQILSIEIDSSVPVYLGVEKTTTDVKIITPKINSLSSISRSIRDMTPLSIV